MYGSIYPELQIESRMSNTTIEAPLTSYLSLVMFTYPSGVTESQNIVFFISAAKSLHHKATGLHSLCLK